MWLLLRAAAEHKLECNQVHQIDMSRCVSEESNILLQVLVLERQLESGNERGRLVDGWLGSKYQEAFHICLPPPQRRPPQAQEAELSACFTCPALAPMRYNDFKRGTDSPAHGLYNNLPKTWREVRDQYLQHSAASSVGWSAEEADVE